MWSCSFPRLPDPWLSQGVSESSVGKLYDRGVGEGLVTYQGVGQLFLTMSAWMRTMFMAKRDPVALPVFGSS